MDGGDCTLSDAGSLGFFNGYIATGPLWGQKHLVNKCSTTVALEKR